MARMGLIVYGIRMLELILLFLAAAVLTVPVFQKMGLGSVLAYLFAGVLIGPSILGWVQEVESIRHFSELGVVMLLFLIGLELNFGNLRKLRNLIFGLGGLQLLGAALVIGLGANLLGLDFRASAWVGLAFAMSSTAIGLQLLKEKGLFETPGGVASLSVLLFQDLSAIAMIATLPLWTGGFSWSSETGLKFGKAVGVIALVIFAGRYLLRPVFRWVASTNLREVFTAFALLLVFGVALLMEKVGLSMALGTFLGGVLLADSEYRMELEINVEPFKGLLLGLFFMSVGMSMPLSDLSQFWHRVLLWTSLILVIKIAWLFFLGLRFGLSRCDSWNMSVGISQVGEFAFVLLGLGASSAILPQDQLVPLSLAVVLSMIATPLLFWLIEQLQFVEENAELAEPKPFEAPAEVSQVVIAGYGRFGGLVGRVLMSKGIHATVIDRDPGQIELVRRFGFKAYYGDITRIEVMRLIQLEKVKHFIIAVDSFEAILKTVEYLQLNHPDVQIYARCRNRQEAFQLMKKNVPVVVRETFGSALELGEAVLTAFGHSEEDAHCVVRAFRKHDLDLMRETFHKADDESFLISKGRQARDQFAALLKEDAESATAAVEQKL